MKKRDLKDKGFRDELTAQALEHITFDRRAKQPKIAGWHKNEDMYYGKKIAATESRANIELGRMQEFVHTLQSKINNQQIFKFTKRKESQLKRVKRLNALRDVDRNNDFWDIKLMVAKKQVVIYGRMIFSYYADSIDGIYRAHLDPIDVYDFLIDPSAGGIDVERAEHLGDYGVIFTRQQLEEGIKGSNREFFLNETKELLAGDGNNTESTQEETNKQNRTYGVTSGAKKETNSKDKFKFFRWFETFEGERYYMLLQETAGRTIKIEKLSDIISPTKQFPKSPWPYWTAAAFPDLTEFWTPAYCDYVREIFMGQNVSINQMFDNAEEINKPLRVVNVGAIKNLSELKYRRKGIVKVNGDADVDKAYKEIRPASIQTPILVFDKLEAIQEKASGVTSGAKGVSDENGKVGIYEGNQQEAQDRFELLDKSTSFGVNRFGRLYEIGVKDHLTKKVAVDMIGTDGIETEEVTKRDIFRKTDEFGLTVESAAAEQAISNQKQSTKINFLENKSKDPQSPMNKKKAFEIEAKIAGFTDDEIKQLLDQSEYGTAELMSEAERDIEALIEGDDIKPNMAANNAYKQRFVSYMTDHQEDMDDEMFQRFTDYVKALEPIVFNNEARALNAHAINTLNNVQVPPANGAADPANPNPVQEIPQDNAQI